MCFAIPGKVLEIKDKNVIVDFDGVERKAITELFRIKKGDYVLVFNNFVVERVSREKAKEIWKSMRG